VLFLASFETTTTFLRWAMVYMINFPDVQRKVQEELDRVVGLAAVKFGDRTRLPYTEATILEIFRFANYIPFLLPHKTTEDVTFEGYHIPKSEFVLQHDGSGCFLLLIPFLRSEKIRRSPCT
jgi:cytochrome P450